MRGELFGFIGILILIFVLWVSTGGPSRPISFTGPYLQPIQTTGTTAEAYGDPSKFSSINSNITVGVNGIRTEEGASSLQGTVALSRDTSGVTSTDPDGEYVVINYSSSGRTPLSTSGWKLVSNESKKSALIPQGASTPRSGRVNTLASITLSPGEQMIVVSGRSPVGISFRENKCTGYFEERQDFHPALFLNCPTPSQEFSRFYRGDDNTDSCINYVRSIPYCATETRTSTSVSSSCEQFVEEHLNYNSCVDAHQGDADFNGTVWRVFLGERNELWRRDRETILLLDAENKVIDALTY